MTQKSVVRHKTNINVIRESVRKTRQVTHAESGGQDGNDKGKPVPCDFKALLGSSVFNYDPDVDNCHKPDRARIYISKYKKFTGELQAVDLNNIACAYLWQEKPDWDVAEKIFIKALEKETANKTIMENRRKIHRHNPGMPKYKKKIPTEKARI